MRFAKVNWSGKSSARAPVLRVSAPQPWLVSRSPGFASCLSLLSNAVVLWNTLQIERIVTELKDKVPAFANVDPALVHLSGAIDHDRAPRPVTDAISALVNLGYGPPQAAAAIAGASRIAGEKAETAQLIRLGLKELSK